MRLWKMIRTWSRRDRFEADLEEEIRIHREMSGDAAFGSVALALEESREVWGLAWLESWKQDARFALRGFRRSPGFALGVIGAIGLGLGLNTTMFTVFNAYALRPFAVRDPYGLYAFTWNTKTGAEHWFSWDRYQDLRKQKTAFSDVLAFANLGAQVDGRTLFGQLVSGNYFTMLGVGMAQGRPLTEDDTGAVMVLSYDAWRNRFGADPNVLGRKVYLRGQPFEVVGIAHPAFSGLEGVPAGFWVPLRTAPAVMDGDDLFGARQPEHLRLIGRLQPGVRPEAARSGLLPWVRGFRPEAARVYLESRASSVPLTREVILAFIPLFTAFALVLAIACANVSNMMLARALARQREIGIRVSLGAGRARLVRQLLTESVLLALPAAAAGFLISEVTVDGGRRLLFRTVPDAFRRILAVEDLSPDWRVFGFILAGALVTAMLFGLAPAIQTTRSRLVEANRGDFSSDYRPARLRNALVIAQVAVSALLLASTALALRSEGRIAGRPLGLDTHAVWDVRTIARRQAKVAARLAEEPGIEAVAAAWHAPLYGLLRHIVVVPSGRSDSVRAGYNFVSAGYFSVFRIPLLRGRAFTEAESQAEAPVAVVSESTARRLWPRSDAVGQSLAIAPPAAPPDPRFSRSPRFPAASVVGVVADAMSGVIANGPEESSIYFPTHAGVEGNDSVLVRMRGTPAGARQRLEAALDRIAPSLADFVNPMDEVLALQVYPFRVTSWIAGFLAGVALLLTVSGIYGVMSYLVGQRTKEIGIRVALGAGAWELVGMVVRQSACLAGIGAVLGTGAALALAPLIAHEIDGIQPYDWVPYAATAALVLLAAAAASFAPARRAVGIDPIQTLRCD